MRILLVDDHTLFIEGLKLLLESEGMDVVGIANDGREALDRVRVLRPDIVLMDVNMPRCNGIEGTRLIKAEFPDVKVIMLTVSTQDKDLFDAIKSGASGYIDKSIKPKAFVASILGVTRGEAALTREMASRVLDEFVRSDRRQGDSPEETPELNAHSPNGLSPRQTEVLRYVTEGYSYKEIAAALAISERTVNYHMAEIMSKLHFQNRAQVIAYAARNGLVDSVKPGDGK